MSEDFQWGIEHLDDVVPLHPSRWAYSEDLATWVEIRPGPIPGLWIAP